MAIGATIFKVNLNLSNLNSHYYDDFNLTIAKHPSENDERMMYRIIAFLFCAHQDLELTKGLSSTEEPDLWQRDITGRIIHWIELGLPDERRIKQACGKSDNVTIFTYHENKTQEWITKISASFKNNDKVKIYHINTLKGPQIESLIKKSMRLSALIEENILYLSDDDDRIGIEFKELL